MSPSFLAGCFNVCSAVKFIYVNHSLHLMPENNDDEPVVQGEEPQFLEPEEHEDSHMEHQMKIRIGEQEEDVYTEEGREEMLETDEIEPWEEGFAEGAEGRGELATCAHCNKVLGDDKEKVVERKYNNELMFFCSENCAKAGPRE